MNLSLIDIHLCVYSNSSQLKWSKYSIRHWDATLAVYIFIPNNQQDYEILEEYFPNVCAINLLWTFINLYNLASVPSLVYLLYTESVFINMHHPVTRINSDIDQT